MMSIGVLLFKCDVHERSLFRRVTMGNISAAIEFTDSSKQYLADRTLRSFPSCRSGKPGTVVTSFNALPPTPGLTIGEDARLSWWVDCHFLPLQDDTLVTSVAAYHLRPGHTPLRISSQADGLICIWTLGQSLKCEALRGTSSQVYPHIAVHPNSQEIAHIGRGKVIIQDLNTNKTLTKEKDISHNNFRFVAFSPSSTGVAILSRLSNQFELAVYSSSSLFLPFAKIVCHKLCPGFIGGNSYTEQVECKWSPDSLFLAVSSSMGHLFVVKKQGLQIYANVIPGIFEMDSGSGRLANARCFDFHPQYLHNVMCVGTQSNDLHIVDIECNKIICSTHVDVLNRGTVTCVQYNQSGTSLAVGDSQACVHIYNPHTLDFTYRLDAQQASGVDCSILRMSFSYEGNHLAVCSTDGKVRVWQLWPDLSLQDLCRKSILQKVSPSCLKQLPIPRQILMFLLQVPSG